MRTQIVERWELKLKNIFDKIDDFLEAKYGKKFLLHPSRLPQGEASNKEDDGLFDLGASFSAGFGTESGPGYIFKVRFATLQKVPSDFQKEIEIEVVELLEKFLPEEFPDKKLQVGFEDGIYKIFGDLSLE